MLARLDSIEGVAASRVDWSGRRFLLELKPGSDARAVAADARDVLGRGTRRLGARDESATVESYRRGERWMRTGESRAMSREEARVLAGRFAGEIATAARLDREESERFASLVLEEVSAAFERAHDEEGGVPGVRAQLSRVVERIGERLDRIVPPEKAAAVRAAVEAISG